MATATWHRRHDGTQSLGRDGNRGTGLRAGYELQTTREIPVVIVEPA